MWVVQWVKNNFCRGNKLRISGFTTTLHLGLSITLIGNTIGINTAKQCKYSNLHKSIPADCFWEAECKKMSLLPHWPLLIFNIDGPSCKDMQYISIHLIFRHMEKNGIFLKPSSLRIQELFWLPDSPTGSSRGPPHTPLSHSNKVSSVNGTSPTMDPERSWIMAQYHRNSSSWSLLGTPWAFVPSQCVQAIVRALPAELLLSLSVLSPGCCHRSWALLVQRVSANQ